MKVKAEQRLRPDETAREGARRVATDAVYAARDRGGTMHDAGSDAADAVLAMLLDAGWLRTPELHAEKEER